MPSYSTVLPALTPGQKPVAVRLGTVGAGETLTQLIVTSPDYVAGDIANAGTSAANTLTFRLAIVVAGVTVTNYDHDVRYVSPTEQYAVGFPAYHFVGGEDLYLVVVQNGPRGVDTPSMSATVTTV